MRSKAPCARHLLPLRGEARRVVHEHRFWITELYHFPGVLVQNKKLKQMLERKGKSGMESFGSDSVPALLLDLD